MEEPLLVPPEKKMQYLGTFGIIKSAIEVPLRSHTIIIFTFLISLPFFFTTLLQKLPSLINFSFSNSISSHYYYYYYSDNNLIHDTALVLDFTTWLLKRWLIDFFRFAVAITTIYSASKVYTTKRSMNLGDLMRCYPITKASVMGPLFTFLVMSVFSSISLDLVTQWGGWGPLVKTRTMFFQVMHGMSYAAGLTIWSGYCALWNVGVVMSVLEGNRVIGLEAFSASSDLMRGNRVRGAFLMVFYHVWWLGLGLPTYFPIYSYWGSFSDGIVYKIVDTILLCLGLVMNWVVCVVYYHDCKNRRRGKEKDLNLLVQQISPKFDQFLL